MRIWGYVEGDKELKFLLKKFGFGTDLDKMPDEVFDDLTGPGGASKGNPKYKFLGVERYWAHSKENMEKMYKEGKIVQTKPGTVPRRKRYLDEMPGVALQNLWTDINPVQSHSKEKTYYPTQKPEALLKRIIELGSNENDLVADFF